MNEKKKSVEGENLTPEDIAKEELEELRKGVFISKEEGEVEKETPKVRKTLAETLGITQKEELPETGEARMKKRKEPDVGEPEK